MAFKKYTGLGDTKKKLLRSQDSSSSQLLVSFSVGYNLHWESEKSVGAAVVESANPSRWTNIGFVCGRLVGALEAQKKVEHS